MSKWNFHLSSDISLFVGLDQFSVVLSFLFHFSTRKSFLKNMSCTRSQILRKQKSCANDGTSAALRYRERRFQLQKQFSFDQGQNVRPTVCHRGALMDIDAKNSFAKIEDVLPEASLQVFNAFNAKPHGNCDHEKYVKYQWSCKIEINNITLLRNKGQRHRECVVACGGDSFMFM